MSFSRNEFMNALNLLAERLPEFSESRAANARLLRITSDRMSAHINESLKDFGLSENLLYALLAVYVSPNCQILPSRLSDLLDLTRTSATRLSDEMVEHGWVVRHINEQDRRQIVLSLTEKGETFIKDMNAKNPLSRNDLWVDFSDEELDQFQSLLFKLLSRLGG
ncbi:MAG: MarR family transcriptional regulator [Neisseria sp.]